MNLIKFTLSTIFINDIFIRLNITYGIILLNLLFLILFYSNIIYKKIEINNNYLIYFYLLLATPSINFMIGNNSVIFRYFYIISLYTFFSFIPNKVSELENNYEKITIFFGKLMIIYGVVLYLLSIKEFYSLVVYERYEGIVIPVYIFIGLYLIYANSKYKNYLAYIICVNIIVYLFSHSRGAFISSLILVGAMHSNIRDILVNKKILYIYPVLAIIFTGYFIFIEGALDFNNSLLTGRAAIWNYWYQILLNNREYLLFGLGDPVIGSMFDVMSLKFNNNWNFITSPHNYLIAEICRSGLYGFTLLLIGYFSIAITKKINLKDPRFFTIFLIFGISQLFSGQSFGTYSVDNFILVFCFFMMFCKSENKHK